MVKPVAGEVFVEDVAHGGGIGGIDDLVKEGESAFNAAGEQGYAAMREVLRPDAEESPA